MHLSDDCVVLYLERSACTVTIQSCISDLTFGAGIHNAVTNADTCLVGRAQAADNALFDLDNSVCELNNEPRRRRALRRRNERRAEAGQINLWACRRQQRAVTQT